MHMLQVVQNWSFKSYPIPVALSTFTPFLLRFHPIYRNICTSLAKTFFLTYRTVRTEFKTAKLRPHHPRHLRIRRIRGLCHCRLPAHSPIIRRPSPIITFFPIPQLQNHHSQTLQKQLPTKRTPHIHPMQYQPLNPRSRRRPSAEPVLQQLQFD